MKKSILRIVSFIICAVMVFSLTGCKKEEAIDITEFMPSGKLQAGVLDENDKYALVWDDDEKCVVITDKATGVKWATTPSEYLDTPTEEKQHRARNFIESAIYVNYKVPGESAVATARAFTHSVYKGTFASEYNKETKTVTVSYMFKDADCIVPVDYSLTANGIKIAVDTAKIVEGENAVYSIDIAPYFCAAEHGREDSYVFYPSGSGAIIDLNDPVIETSTYTSEVYGRDASLGIKHDLTNQKNVYLPVYGLKKGNEAVCAIITSGVENASVTAVVNDTATAYTTVYASFALRSGDYTYSNVGAADRLIYSSEPIKDTVFAVEFVPLSGEDASYIGMAKCYQRYLYGDNEANEKAADPVYSLEFIGGVLEKKNFLGFPYDALLPLTTYSQAKDILTELSSTGVRPNVLFTGFGESGLDVKKIAGGFGLGSAFGSKKELSSLTQYCKENSIASFVDFNLTEFSVGSDGYTTADSAKSASKMAAYVYKITKGAQILDKENYDRHRMFSRNKLDGVANKLFKKLSSYDISGVSFETLTATAYSDFDNPDYFVKGNMGVQAQGIMNTYKNGGYQVAASGANAYAITSADVVFNTPVNSSRQEIFTHDVPFYQIVTKGKTAITSEPVNTGIAFATKKLMALEGGASMLFTLYNNYDVTATLSSHKDIYGGMYSGNKDDIIKAAADYSDYYKAISGQTIKNHEIVNDDVRITTYSNGVKIYVNYSEDDYQSADGVVKANDCLIIL